MGGQDIFFAGAAVRYVSAGLLAVISYFGGGIPTGYLIAKQFAGIDIRDHGSGNPGAANVYRVVGKGAGVATFMVDALKGYLPILMARHFFPSNDWLAVICGALAILGHVWTVFLRLKGGKAVATSLGVFLALSPIPAFGAFVVFTMGVALTGHISVGSMAGAALFPFMLIAARAPLPQVLLSFAASILILIRHIPNLKRLLESKELHYSGHNGNAQGLEKK